METKTQHTPGPWSIGRANPESGQTFVNIMSHSSRIGTVIHGGAEKGEANARLIAAAPDLLAACSHGAAVLHAVHTGNVPRGLIPHIDSERILRDAIARAKGDA